MLNSRQISQKSAFQNRVAERMNSSKLQRVSPKSGRKIDNSWEDIFEQNPINTDLSEEQKISLLLFSLNMYIFLKKNQSK
ncbi:hypothetical protein TTHERM_00437580 (macronuclear) [Tetrahymena thermophila SB210]|uniref:Uncharacterized protein n=1 Tax=Tetrahymena thermophila (strain SB210) TaxID=312017 RepID=I7LV97_TETTS|nr:hypothetical protein TTHERM_00437580 [Tetrahymena thermophila SB210]EAR97509.1 hypothetical protein TTHERM_00437580 [Tetrahymena thermophila SB210]|eukprot:XP_001017754.1 hypothetical protein TTHERM_00437580 [Tetrahymena thermophila SB210]